MLSFLMAMLRRIKYNLSRNGINTSAVCKRIFFIQRKTEQSLLCSDVVRVAGLEPVQSCLHKNLNLARLPIPPYPHIKFCPLNFTRRGHPRRSLLSDKSYFSADSATVLKMCYIIIADRQVSVKSHLFYRSVLR